MRLICLLLILCLIMPMLILAQETPTTIGFTMRFAASWPTMPTSREPASLSS